MSTYDDWKTDNGINDRESRRYEEGLDATSQVYDEWIKKHRSELIEIRKVVEDLVTTVAGEFEAVSGFDFVELSPRDFDLSPWESILDWFESAKQKKLI